MVQDATDRAGPRVGQGAEPREDEADENRSDA